MSIVYDYIYTFGQISRALYEIVTLFKCFSLRLHAIQDDSLIP